MTGQGASYNIPINQVQLHCNGSEWLPDHVEEKFLYIIGPFSEINVALLMGDPSTS